MIWPEKSHALLSENHPVTGVQVNMPARSKPAVKSLFGKLKISRWQHIIGSSAQSACSFRFEVTL